VYVRTNDVAGTRTNPKFFINALLKRVSERQSQDGLFYTVTICHKRVGYRREVG